MFATGKVITAPPSQTCSLSISLNRVLLCLFETTLCLYIDKSQGFKLKLNHKKKKNATQQVGLSTLLERSS